ncbi:MAG: hypothetical protein IKY54_01485, partial [Muribaculaceae bacterium]|nr:hypothetical protein [Muribaculaceae bacterium]
MNRVYKYIILAVSLLLLIGVITFVVLKNSQDEEVIPVPAETYYITVEKDIKTNFRGSYQRIFNDKNNLHLDAADVYGIAPESVDIASDTLSGKLEKVATCDYY